MSLRTIPEIKEGTYRAKASGTLPNGKPVVVNSDGTVSVVEETSLTQASGSPTVFESAATIYTSATFDSTNARVVIAYQDDGNFKYGTAVVGTVNDMSISFGTPTVFESASSNEISSTFDSNANRVVIAYRDQGNSDHGTAIVGTVSSTSISFGSPTVFESSQSTYISATFDPNANKVIIAYSDGGNSFYGTAIVGTVSSTSISFGSPTVFESDAAFLSISATFDSNADRVVIAYVDFGNSSYGTAVVGTVSGTSISFGTPVIFESANSESMSATFDSNENKVVIAYHDNGNSSYGTVIVGTVSGTSISFGSPTVFESATTSWTSSTFDSNSNRVVIAYRDSGNSSYGTSVVFRNATTVPNLTSENFIGLSTGGTYADGSSATVDIVGMVNTNQTGLTPGQQYYVQTDGTLGTAEADPSVLAGTAVTSTSLLVKL